MDRVFALQFILFIFLFTIQVQSQSHISTTNLGIDEDCLKCICTANTGCQEINECFEDSSEDVRCGMFLLKESQWNYVQKSSNPNLRRSNISTFEQCFSNFDCSSDLVNAYTLMHFISSNNSDLIISKLNKQSLTCADIAFFNQFGHSQVRSEIENQYSKVLKTHLCMNGLMNETFQIKLKDRLNSVSNLAHNSNQITKIDQHTHITHFNHLNQISNLNLQKILQQTHDQDKYINISIVPRRCFDCIRTANNYNYQNSEKCSHPQLKCGPYAINLEYFLQAKGNLVTKNFLPLLYNSTSELENQNQLLDTIDLLNKVSNVDHNKQFRKEGEDFYDDDKYEDYKIDYNKKLSQLLDFDHHVVAPVAKGIFYERKPKRKNSKLMSRLVGDRSKLDGLGKSRRNSKFSREPHETDSSFKSVSMNEELSVKQLVSTASYQNFANCAINLQCSEQLINIYVKQHLFDCNLDSNIDCDDFASLHWLGKKNCKQNTMLYSNLWKNFEYCSILADDVRKEELAISDEMNGNDKNHYELTNIGIDASNLDVPVFQVRPNFQQMNVTNSNENPTFHPDLNQYYSSHVVDLSNDCLQCICEASSEGYNCSQILNPPSNFYFSAYKMAPPPQIVYLKTNNRMPKTTSLNTLSQLNSLKRNLIKLMRNSDLETIVLDEKKNCDNDKNGCGPFSLTKLHFLESMINTYWYRGAAGDWSRCAENVECSIQTVEKFVTKFSMDCTKDGRLSCHDFGLIHRFKDKCTDLNVLNTDYYRKFEKCLIKLSLH